jgi:hypothetical protein
MNKKIIKGNDKTYRNKLFMSVNFFVLVLLVLNISMCKKSSDNDELEQFTLTVNLSEGIKGSPDTGATIYSKNENISYDYKLEEGYKNLLVSIDGNTVSNDGSITMDKSHSIAVTAEKNNVYYTLDVSVGAGISGTPDTGTQSLAENCTVSYNYELLKGYKNLAVNLDGTSVDKEGHFTMGSNHKLNVTAEEGYELRSKWALSLSLENKGTNASVLEVLNVDIEFSGNPTSGDVYIGGNKVGSYTVDNEKVNFSYTIPDTVYTQLIYKYTGSFIGNDEMSGNVSVYYDNGLPNNNVKAPKISILCKKGKWSGRRKSK